MYLQKVKVLGLQNRVTGLTGSPDRWIPGSLSRCVTKCDPVPSLKPTITPTQWSRDPFLHFGAIPLERVKLSISNFGMQIDRKECYYSIRMSKFRSMGCTKDHATP